MVQDQQRATECVDANHARGRSDRYNKGGDMTRHIGISVPHRRVEEDDDIQDYKKPWVGLTYEDQEEIVLSAHSIRDAINKTDQKLKEKNT